MNDPVWSFSSSIDVGRAGGLLDGRFRFVGELGRGGMGVVYQARDLDSGRDVAVKLVIGQTKLQSARFQREGQLAAALDHPGIVKVHSAGEVDGRPYLVYELVEDCQALDEVLEGLPRTERVAMLRDVARALGYAHARGIVHRDVKPDNILVDALGRARLADFGLATAADVERLTKSGAIVGTPYYMAPEQFSGASSAGPPADVWAVGVLLYQAITGELPFEGENLPQLAVRIAAGSASPPRRIDSSIPANLEAVCMWALQHDPQLRYPDGDALADDLDLYLAGEAPSATSSGVLARLIPRRRWGGLALTGCALAALAAVALRVSRETPPPPNEPVRVELQGPSERETLAADFVLSGRMSPAGSAGLIRVGDRTQPIPAGESFTLRVPLAEGVNEIEVRGLDAAQVPGPVVRVVVTRWAAPSWFRRLKIRPLLPLPPGITWATKGEYRSEREGSTLVWVPPGEFQMGVNSYFPNESPQHPVVFSRGYFIGKHEVTRGQYARFCAATKRPFRVGREDTLPIAGISWGDAQAYCAWAGLRLPSEAEWERAARGDDEREYPWGDQPPTTQHCNWYKVQGKRLLPVETFPMGVSPFGCHDMAGNAGEWVQDWYGPYPKESERDPQGPSSGTLRVRRGGAYHQNGTSCRTTARFPLEPDGVQGSTGLRVAR